MALVLARYSGQSLLVGKALLTFEIDGNRVRVVIDAPPEVRVICTELIRRPVPPRVVSDPPPDQLATQHLEA